MAGRNERSTDPASSGLLSTARISASCGWICFGPRYPCTERSHLRYRGTRPKTRELWITPEWLSGPVENAAATGVGPVDDRGRPSGRCRGPSGRCRGPVAIPEAQWAVPGPSGRCRGPSGRCRGPVGGAGAQWAVPEAQWAVSGGPVGGAGGPSRRKGGVEGLGEEGPRVVEHILEIAQEWVPAGGMSTVAGIFSSPRRRRKFRCTVAPGLEDSADHELVGKLPPDRKRTEACRGDRRPRGSGDKERGTAQAGRVQRRVVGTPPRTAIRPHILVAFA